MTLPVVDTDMTPDEFVTLRKALGFRSQMAVANALNVHTATVSSWEQGKSRIPGPAILALRYMEMYIVSPVPPAGSPPV